ncbi:MAG: L,D-transpeptidase family protein [Pseudomonadota bacterium]
MAEFLAQSVGRFVGGEITTRCALGKGGVRTAEDKIEGDGATPLGVWPLRRVFYRPDRLDPPPTRLTTVPIEPSDGWCDAPGDPHYNRKVKLPYPASAERLWREDAVYDIVVELGYNDDPVVDRRGSAIFFHLIRGDYEPTEGCVALALPDMLAVLAKAAPGDALTVTA